MENAIRKHLDVRRTLAAGFYCGWISVFVDFDHALKIIFFPEQGWRFLHTPILIACCIALLGCGAYLGGLYISHILRRHNETKN